MSVSLSLHPGSNPSLYLHGNRKNPAVDVCTVTGNRKPPKTTGENRAKTTPRTGKYYGLATRPGGIGARRERCGRSLRSTPPNGLSPSEELCALGSASKVPAIPSGPACPPLKVPPSVHSQTTTGPKTTTTTGPKTMAHAKPDGQRQKAQPPEHSRGAGERP